MDNDNYYIKYIKYKTKYLELKNRINENNKKIVGGSQDDCCNLHIEDAKLHFGSGGSNCIIAITDDYVYKYFPLLVSPHDTTDEEITYYLNRYKYEIEIMKILTNKIINNKLSPHIVKYYNDCTCNGTLDDIFKNCPSYIEHLLSNKQTNQRCNLLFNNGYPKKLIKPMYVLKMEKITNMLTNEIIRITKKKYWGDFELFLDVLFFQIFYTLETIKLQYLDYTHNDLFIRNILVENNKYKSKQYIRYHYNNMIFDVPANIIYIKIADFGFSKIDEKSCKKYGVKFVKNQYKDYFTIIYDIYNGANLGSLSLYRLVKDNNKLKIIDKYFNNFFDVKIINKIINNNKKHHLDMDWNNTLDEKFVKLIKLKEPLEYIKRFINIFPYNKKHKIVDEYGL